MNDQHTDIFRLAGSLLRQQAEWGLDGVDVAHDSLRQRVAVARPEPRATAAARPHAVAPSPRAPSLREASGVTPQQGASSTVAADLAEVRTSIGECQRCKLGSSRTNIVFGIGAPDARLMFVGEAPGLDEDLQAEPFVGAAGQLLDRMITAMGMRRSAVYITNVVKCRPPRNRDLEPDEVVACLPFLLAQIRVLRPEVVVTLGPVAAQTLLQQPTPMSRMRGVWHEIGGVAVMPTLHPAELLRHPEEKKLVWQDLQAVLARLAARPAAPA